MSLQKLTGQDYNFEGIYGVRNAVDIEIQSLNEESDYLEASNMSVLSHIRKLVQKVKALDTGNFYQGAINCSANPNYPAASKDQYWRVSAAGKIGGASGIIVEVGDMVFCLETNVGGTEASVGSKFQVQQANINRIYPIAVEDAYTILANTNTAGLSSSITLANEIKSKLNLHFADSGTGAMVSCITLANSLKTTMNLHLNDQGSGTTEHKAKVDQIDADDATDLATLITLTTELLSVYAAHDDDAILASPVIHQAQGTEKALVSADAPTDIHQCLARLNDLKAKLNDHMDDATAHADGDTTQNATANAAYVQEHISAQTAVSIANASDLTTLIALTTALLTAYNSHDDDAELGSAWVYHIGQESGNATLVSAAAPTTLAECITRLNDLKAKLNTHMADGTGAHVDGDSAAVSSADAAVGSGVTVPVTGAITGDLVQWSILNHGSGSASGVSAVPGTDVVVFTFDKTPGADVIISYAVFRPAAT